MVVKVSVQLTIACLCIMERSDPELTSMCTESFSGEVYSQFFLCVLLEHICPLTFFSILQFLSLKMSMSFGNFSDFAFLEIRKNISLLFLSFLLLTVRKDEVPWRFYLYFRGVLGPVEQNTLTHW